MDYKEYKESRLEVRFTSEYPQKEKVAYDTFRHTESGNMVINIWMKFIKSFYSELDRKEV